MRVIATSRVLGAKFQHQALVRGPTIIHVCSSTSPLLSARDPHTCHILENLRVQCASSAHPRDTVALPKVIFTGPISPFHCVPISQPILSAPVRGKYHPFCKSSPRYCTIDEKQVSKTNLRALRFSTQVPRRTRCGLDPRDDVGARTVSREPVRPFSLGSIRTSPRLTAALLEPAAVRAIVDDWRHGVTTPLRQSHCLKVRKLCNSRGSG
ncbi:hypothetical protein C8T65DRAFT_674620 [Cerioporus squamosus]|nr:hypothetical protein C8T65DRAFT_674620 [Cerioporus squamosus]